MKLVKDHWFRAERLYASCAFKRSEEDGVHKCELYREDHVEAVGEWMEPRHFFRPRLREPMHCALCRRRFAHSTHHGSRKNRSLHWDRWNAFWDIVRRRK